jgi:aryl-alcohol dehydrogenase-like predicted oxidoreductase
VVPAIGMGTWRTFDTDEDRRPLVDVALESGIDLFDSSPMYGRAERTLAQALEGIRERVIVATKIWTSSAEEGSAQADHALRLFGHVDIYQVHNLVNVPAQLVLLERLKKEGKVLAVGATHYQESAFHDVAALMKSKRLDMVQIPYNPLRRTAERELLPLAQSMGLGVFVMSPLQNGILDRRASRAQLEELGVETWAQAILKWIASDPRVSTVLTATQDVDHLRENALAGEPPFFTPEQRALVVRIAERN